MNSQQLCYNGIFYPDTTALFTADNRAFRYGDSLFETIHCNGTQIQFFEEHMERLQLGMSHLRMEIPDNFSHTIETNIKNLITKNKSFLGTRIRLSVFRNSGGLYTPQTNRISFLIESSKLDSPNYYLNKKGLKIGLFDSYKKASNSLSGFKTGNSLPFILAGLHKTEMKWDDCLLLNERQNLVESVSSNLFIVKDGILYTPSLESGAINGIMREQIIQIALNLGITVYDDCIMKPEQLMDADEIFLTNAIVGIRWVVAYEERRYFNRSAKVLIEELNKKAFPKN
ncbi:aminotransferase IV [Ancylomarina salipaludis]|uniref:branched-chain-amino-acid transaminase n=1 Tax=Ancylomarina salipaludis TaxID=2501299 RepID=A0A4Q1JPI2_9BACT|nr:aminotransferase class IV [Ancylomarina salipaludis]RXQ96818.1 aminotransferase IV [Ancylomarina salipaludis]